MTFEDILNAARKECNTPRDAYDLIVNTKCGSNDFIIKAIEWYKQTHEGERTGSFNTLFDPNTYHKQLLSVLLDTDLSSEEYRKLCYMYPYVAVDPVTIHTDMDLRYEVMQDVFSNTPNSKELELAKHYKMSIDSEEFEATIATAANLITDNVAIAAGIDLKDKVGRAYYALKILGKLDG